MDNINEIGKPVIEYKETQLSQRPMIVTIEGLSCSGKSTLGQELVHYLTSQGYQGVMLEGDLYHRGRDVVAPIYQELLSNPEHITVETIKRMWRIDDLDQEVVQPIVSFGQEKVTLQLHNVLDDKKDNTEHEQTIEIDAKSIVIIPLMYGRILNGDYSIMLNISVEESIQRKIKRFPQRDPKSTRSMVENVEIPLMELVNKTGPCNQTVQV